MGFDTAAFDNQLPENLANEVAAARAAGVPIAHCPSPQFDQLAFSGDRLVFVLSEGRELIVAPRVHNGFEVNHPVLAEGRRVHAAGEVSLLFLSGHRLVLELTNKSGHYLPDARSLGDAVSAFRAQGYKIPDSAIRSYDKE